MPSTAAVYGISSALSFLRLYRGSFPQLKGGAGSLIYFAQIAKRTPAAFTTEVGAQDSERLLKDVLEQMNSNAVIATKKYWYLCLAYRFMAVSLVPWGIALASFAMQH
ncbi:MAG TPA: Pycsar system effector family protein [Steroidobacter sp.]